MGSEMCIRDSPQALSTEGRPLRDRPCRECKGDVLGETSDVVPADTTDDLPAHSTDVLSPDTTDALSADTRNLCAPEKTLPQGLFSPGKAFVRPRQRSRRRFFPRKKHFVRPRQRSRRAFPRKKWFCVSRNAHAKFSCRLKIIFPF